MTHMEIGIKIKGRNAEQKSRRVRDGNQEAMAYEYIYNILYIH